MRSPLRFDNPPPEPLASAPGFLLSWHGQRTAALFSEALEPLGLHPRHFGVMNLIAAHPGTTQRDLVHGSLVDPSSMVAVIDELEEMGLAERRPHPDDRRKHAVHLTAKGKRTLERARGTAIAMAKELFAPLDAEEVETLRRLLRKLAGLDPTSAAPLDD
jgi:MarR family transcriptional regulator, lower aerobic nicotinate degradation pathway regulator